MSLSKGEYSSSCLHTLHRRSKFLKIEARARKGKWATNGYGGEEGCRARAGLGGHGAGANVFVCLQAELLGPRLTAQNLPV